MDRKNKVLLLAVLITTILVTIFTLSRYKSTMASDNKARPAIPVISFSSNILNIEINPKDNEKDYLFEISNYDETKKSEVTMKYKIQLVTFGNLPLIFELYSYDEKNNIADGENLLNGTSTEEIVMPVEQNINSKYMLKIKWDENESNYLYSNEIDYIQLVLNTEQVD